MEDSWCGPSETAPDCLKQGDEGETRLRTIPGSQFQEKCPQKDALEDRSGRAVIRNHLGPANTIPVSVEGI